VFEEVIRKQILWGTRDEVRRDCRRLHNKELHEMYFRLDIWMIFSRRMQWARHVENMGDRRGVYMVWAERLEERRPL